MSAFWYCLFAVVFLTYIDICKYSSSEQYVTFSGYMAYKWLFDWKYYIHFLSFKNKIANGQQQNQRDKPRCVIYLFQNSIAWLNSSIYETHSYWWFHPPFGPNLNFYTLITRLNLQELRLLARLPWFFFYSKLHAQYSYDNGLNADPSTSTHTHSTNYIKAELSGDNSFFPANVYLSKLRKH